MALDHTVRPAEIYFGWKVVGAAFVVAIFGWGIGFYGPSVFLRTLHAERGWSIAVVSGAITAHFIFSALATAYLPEAYGRWGVVRVTRGGSRAHRDRRRVVGERARRVAAIPGRDPQRRRLGGDDGRRDQRDRRALVRPGPAKGAEPRLQRRQHRRAHLHAALGRADRATGVRDGSDADGDGGGRDPVAGFGTICARSQTAVPALHRQHRR